MTGRPPNLLLIFTDQQRWDTIRALGNRVIATPNLDRLAREGASAVSAYTPSPVCVSARASMHYGRYPAHTGVYDNDQDYPEGLDSYVDLLTQAGYRTHAIGKCHFRRGTGDWGYETREIQEEVYLAFEEDDYLAWLTDEGFGDVIEPHGSRGEMYYVPQVSRLPETHHPSAWVGQRASAFITQQAADPNRPWHLFTSFIHPHPPFAPPEPWNKLYRSPLMPLPLEPRDHESLLTWINLVQNRYKYRDDGFDRHLMQTIIAYYYACISFVDRQVGTILHDLERTGQLENTLIVYTSDHGELLGDYRSFGKRSHHDGATRIPMVLRWPGHVPAGHRVEAPLNLVDVGPTLLTAAGVDPTEMDGTDAVAVANGAGGGRDAVVGQFSQAQGGIYYLVTPRWKFAWSASDRREFLFDRRTDPHETRNRIGLPDTADVEAQLRQRLIETLRDQGEEDALDGDGWRLYEPLDQPPSPDGMLIPLDPPGFKLDLPGYTDLD